MQKGQRMRPPSRTALNGPSRPRISLSLSCSHLSDHLSICSGERCDDDNDSDYGYHSVCLVTQGLHRRSQLILTTSPFYSHPTQSLSAHCVPGTVLGPGNPLVNEADKGPCRQGAQILEMRKLRSKEYLCVSAGPPRPQPQELSWGLGLLCAYIPVLGVEVSRCEESSGNQDLAPVLPLTNRGKLSLSSPSCTTEWGWRRWHWMSPLLHAPSSPSTPALVERFSSQQVY